MVLLISGVQKCLEAMYVQFKCLPIRIRTISRPLGSRLDPTVKIFSGYTVLKSLGLNFPLFFISPFFTT